MSFEEEYPSLFIHKQKGSVHYSEDVITECCLDKAKVKKAIFLCYQKLYLSQDSLGHNKVMSDYMGELEKEVGLK